MLRIERDTGLFSFLAVLGGIIRYSVHRTNLCISRNLTICSQTTKGHTKPCTGCMIPQIVEWCSPYTQMADTSRIQQVLVLVSDFKPFLPENLHESGMDIGFTVGGKPGIGKTVNGIAVIGNADTIKYHLSNYERIICCPDISISFSVSPCLSIFFLTFVPQAIHAGQQRIRLPAPSCIWPPSAGPDGCPPAPAAHTTPGR